MPSIKARMEALAEQLKVLSATPYEELDLLSQGIVDYIRELKALDTPEKKAAYCKASGLTLEQLEEHIRAMPLDGNPAK